MSEIPEEYLEKARAAYLGTCAIGGTDRDFIEAIARAIMEAVQAERERCAAWHDQRAFKFRQFLQLGLFLAETLAIEHEESATAIRAGGKS